MAKHSGTQGIIEAIDALAEQVRIFNFFLSLRYLGAEDRDELNAELKKIQDTSGSLQPAPEVTKRFCDCLKRVLSAEGSH
ncbi:MAG: hypothetical protein K5841_10380 [Fretibacterium sp.]|nr:hypothetical protein [Fretibacterium sp.]